MGTPLATRRRATALCLVAALAGCSAANDAPNPTYMPGDASMSTPGGNFDAGTPSGKVAIEIRAPLDGAMLSTNAAADVNAKVSITDGTDLIDPATVRATLTSTESGATLSAAPLIGPAGDMEYHGRVSLAGVKTGEYKLTVTARSTTNAAGSASVTIKIDSGPLITVLSPVPGRSYKGSLIVQLVADPGAFGPVSDVQATIAGRPVALQPAGPPNQFRAAFDLTQPQQLQGEQIFTVSAKNANGTRTEIRFLFFVDLRGPKITQTKPAPGEIVGGVIKIEAHIEDPAGLNESSLQVLVGDKITPQVRLALAAEGGGIYGVLFDTKLIGSCSLKGGLCVVRPSLSFRAADLLGNETNEAYEIAIDNIPPIADLDPPNVRVSKLDNGYRCSHDFDPLDRNTYVGDMPNDLCSVGQMFDLRARIEDDGNTATGIKAVPISTVDQERTAIYVLDTTTINNEAQILVVDSDGDGYCDSINPRLETTTTPITNPRQAFKLRLRPVPPGGDGDFATLDPNLPPGCLPGIDPDVPEDLCKPGPQPSIALGYAGGLPAIWAIEPIAPANPGYCFGSQLDTFGNNISAVHTPGVATDLPPARGWKCIAVVATDKAGNVATSAPLRVYLRDYDNDGSQAFCRVPPANAGPPPNCTGTFDKATGVVSPKACLTRKFTPGEICYRGDCH